MYFDALSNIGQLRVIPCKLKEFAVETMLLVFNFLIFRFEFIILFLLQSVYMLFLSDWNHGYNNYLHFLKLWLALHFKRILFCNFKFPGVDLFENIERLKTYFKQFSFILFIGKVCMNEMMNLSFQFTILFMRLMCQWLVSVWERILLPYYSRVLSNVAWDGKYCQEILLSRWGKDSDF